MRPMTILVGTFVVYITMKGRFRDYMDLALTKAEPGAPGNASGPASVASPSDAGSSISRMAGDMFESLTKNAVGFN